MSRERTTPYDVNGRTVFITGAARGIGAATARRLHAKGANVALVGLEPDRLEELAAQLGDRAVSFEVDVTDFDALQRAVRATIERFGALDVAIANAGVQFNGALATAPVEHVERTLAVNLLGVWRTDRAVIEHITARRGYLLNISSLSAIIHAPMLGAYSTAKAGVEALSDALRLETASVGRARGLRLLRLCRHRPGARRLRRPLGPGRPQPDAGLHRPDRPGRQGDRRDRGRHRTPCRAHLGAALGWTDAALAGRGPAADRAQSQTGYRAARRKPAPRRPCRRRGRRPGSAAGRLRQSPR